MNYSDPETVELSSRLACVTITYNPDMDVLRLQLQALPHDCLKFIVDNGSSNQKEIQNLERTDQSISLICHKENLGLAEALNRGVKAATTSPGIDYVLLLDQDSVPSQGAVRKLFTALQSLERKIGPSAVGPRMMDTVTGLHHGFHVIKGFLWARVYPQAESAPISCANINGSGIMTSLSAWNEVGGMDADLFIDHVDTDWSFRMLSRGMRLYGVPNADFSHAMGVDSRKVWCFGWHILPVRSPQRHYYLYRNTFRLMSRPYVPLVWKVWAVPKMLLTILLILIAGPERLKNISSILKGMNDA